MSNQLDINRLCHTISFIIIPGSRSLICQLFSSIQLSKKLKECHDFSSQRKDQSAPLLSLGIRRRKRGGIYSGRFFTCMNITTHVSPHQDRPRQTTRYFCRSLSRTSLRHSIGHLSFWGYHRLENSYNLSTFLSTIQPFSRQLLPLQARHP